MKSPAPALFSPLAVFFLLLALLSVVLPVSAGSITFKGEDGAGRVIHFTGNGEVSDLYVAPGESIAQEFPDGWTGNFYATCEGCDDAPGMLGEVAFDGFEGKTFYDVSAIVDSEDHAGVHRFSPDGGDGEQAGCDEFPCPESTYYEPDDVQTKVSESKDFVVSLSGGGGSKSGSSGGNGNGDGDDDDEAGGDDDVVEGAAVDADTDGVEGAAVDADADDVEGAAVDGDDGDDGDDALERRRPSGTPERRVRSGTPKHRGRSGITKGRSGITKGRHGITKGRHGFIKPRLVSPRGTVIVMVPAPAPVPVAPTVKST